MVYALGRAARLASQPQRVREVAHAQTAAVVGERMCHWHRHVRACFSRHHRRVAEIVRVAEVHLTVGAEQHEAVVSDRFGRRQQAAQRAALEFERAGEIVCRLDRHHLSVQRILRRRVASAVRLAYLRKAADPLHRSEQIYQPHQIIAAHVEYDSAARTEREPPLGIFTPALVVVAAHQRDISRDGRTENTAVVDLPRGLQSRSEVGVGRAAAVEPEPLRRLDEVKTLVEPDRHHLLAVDVLAGEQRILRDLVMRRMVGEVDDQLDSRVVPDFLVGHLTNAVLLGFRRRPLGLYIRDSDHLDGVIPLC